MTTLAEWAVHWRIPPEALADLRMRLVPPVPALPPGPPRSEAAVQVDVRLAASRLGIRVWRNNVGVLPDKRGIPVRFGLANDSAAVNKVTKSADLVGIRPMLITPAHVGTVVGQFWCRECKSGGWRYTGTDREPAQLNWAEIVLAAGGDAGFISDERQLTG